MPLLNGIMRIGKELKMMEEIQKKLIDGDNEALQTLVKEALESGVQAANILEDGLLKGMEIIGERFKNKEVFVPEVLFAARAMLQVLDILDPYLAEQGGGEAKGKVVIGTVKGDVHNVGKNLVGIMFRGTGLDVVDIGVDVPTEKFVDEFAGQEADFVALSCLLTTSLPQMEETVRALKEKGSKVMIGGAVVTAAFAEKIGADAYAADAGSAAQEAARLMGR
jgi:5-methyltetrahydrofolate--homocysteine methyltransferase